MKNNKKTLIVIAGVAGEIGTEYAKRFVGEKHTDVLGVIRTKKVTSISNKNFTQLRCDLDSEADVARKFKKVDIESYARVVFLHTIGVDKFNPRNYPNITKLKTIDPDVYDRNVNSFKYIFRHLVKRVASANESGADITMKAVIIAGVADKHAPFVIEDFCECKLILRAYIQSHIDMYPEWFSGLSINITSTITDSAIKVRPNANTEDWLTPEDVAERSVIELLKPRPKYKEVDIIKFSKNYVKGYYENHKMLYEKWSKETGIFSPMLA
jgi:hypothetical protein